MAKNEGMEKHEEFKAEFKKRVKEQAKMLYRKSLDEISDRHKFVCVAYAVKDIVIDQWIATQKAYDEKDAKIVYYLSMEFLMGRALGNMIINLSSRDEIKEAIEELGLDLNVIEDQEPDAALGNGGLGRLAACFLDSLSTLNYPAYGCGIRYKYGMFQQKIENGYQKEIPEDWLRHANPLEIKREEYACEVKFGGYVRVENRDGRNYFIQEGYQSVNAIPYDMPIVGYGNNVVNTLRIWDAEPVVHFNLDEFDKGSYMAAVEQENLAKTITEVLYPNDNHYAGKELRLKQQYFFVSASLQTAIKKYLKNHDDIRKLPEKVVFQMNDTHPTLTVAELMRLLMDEYNLEWDEAWDITTHACAYTNHTIMSEALEKWPIELFSRLLPRCYQIIEEINRRFCIEIENKYPGNHDKVAKMAIIYDGQVKRLHEYKRQLLNILHVMYLYNQIKEHPEMEFYPRKFIFGAKAAAGYKIAKLTIKLINSVADVINNDESINGKIKVVFIENYRVSNAEIIFAAADVSEQISTASKEASGTGNMKFMLNGALTLGTMDGANVEIVDEVGEENAFIFGLSSDEVINYENNGGYNPMDIFNSDMDIRKVLMQLINGFYSPDDPERFRPIYNSLLNTQETDVADRYFILKDFKSYAAAQKRVEEAYRNEEGWAKSAMLNVANVGKFTSDRTIEEYVQDIWHLEKVKVKMDV